MAQAQQAEQQLIDQQMAEAEELQIMLENDINAAEKQQQTAKRQADASSNSGSSSSSLSIQSSSSLSIQSSSSSSSSSSGNIEGGSNTVWKTYTQVIDSLSNEFTDHERKIQWKEGIIYIIGSKCFGK